MLTQMDTVVGWAESAIEAFEAARVAEEAAGVNVDQLIEQVKQEAKTQIQAISGAAMAELAAVPSWAGGIPAAMPTPGVGGKPGSEVTAGPGQSPATAGNGTHLGNCGSASWGRGHEGFRKFIGVTQDPAKLLVQGITDRRTRPASPTDLAKPQSAPQDSIRTGAVALLQLPAQRLRQPEVRCQAAPRRAAHQVGVTQCPELAGKRRPLLRPRAQHLERLPLAPGPTRVGLARVLARVLRERIVVAQAAPLPPPCRLTWQSRFRIHQLPPLRVRRPPQCLRRVFIPLCRGLRPRRLQRVLPGRPLLPPRRRLRRCLLLR